MRRVAEQATPSPMTGTAAPQTGASDAALIALNTAAGVAALGGTWYRVPGLILGGVYAPLSLTAPWAVWRRAPHTRAVALAAGAVRLAWIAAQVAVIVTLAWRRARE